MATQPETPLDLTNEPLIIRRTSKKTSADSKHNGNHEDVINAQANVNDSMDNHASSQQEKSDQQQTQQRQRQKEEVEEENIKSSLKGGEEKDGKSSNESKSFNEERSSKKGKKRKSEVAQLVENEVASPNPLQRTRHGLRPLPQQVDYYQSVLEERKTKVKDKKDDEPEEAPISEEVASPPIKTRRSSVQTRKSQVKEEKPERVPNKEHFSIGDIVWATLPSFRTWFPALLVSHLHCGQRPAKSAHTWVYWFGDHQVSEIPQSKVKSFIPHFSEFSKGTSALTSSRMREALQVLSSRAGLTFAVDMNSDDDPMVEWARNGFQIPAEKQKPGSNPFAADPANPIPPLAACYLPLEALQQEVLKTDDRLQQIAFYEVESADNAVEKDEPLQIPEFKSSQVARIKKGEITINDICIACCCDHNPAADTITGEKVVHPFFEGLLCKQCRETIKTTMYAPGVDNKNSFCAICGQVGKLAVCDGAKCHRVFCFVCINLYVGSEAETEILNATSWDCFLCKEDSLPPESLLKPRPNWRELVKNMYDPLLFYLKREIQPLPKTSLRILSLCDGLSATKVALSKLNLNVSAYYAAETDKDAISIAKHNHSDSITYIDNIESLTPEKLASIAPIDLIIGGTPCVDFPTTSYNRKGLFDLKLGGHHFLLFNNILHLLRHFNKGRHVFFLFDCVASLPNTNRDIISDLLSCKPVTLSAKNVSSPSRSRYLWSNIPGINRPLHPDLHENYLKLSDLIAYRKTSQDTTSTPSRRKDDSQAIPEDPKDLEKFLGFPEGYSEISNLPPAKRISVLSKTWSVPIISHVLWALVDFFETKEN